MKKNEKQRMTQINDLPEDAQVQTLTADDLKLVSGGGHLTYKDLMCSTDGDPAPLCSWN
jgi:hypothetical protein